MHCIDKFTEDLLCAFKACYIASIIFFFIIDVIVMTKIYPTTSYGIVQIYHTDSDVLNTWLQVYGACTATKLAAWPLLLVPYIWIIPGIYLLVSTQDVNNALSETCYEYVNNHTNTFYNETCFVYNNEFEYLVYTNKLETWTSVIGLSIILLCFIVGRYCYTNGIY